MKKQMQRVFPKLYRMWQGKRARSLFWGGVRESRPENGDGFGKDNWMWWEIRLDFPGDVPNIFDRKRFADKATAN